MSAERHEHVWSASGGYSRAQSALHEHLRSRLLPIAIYDPLCSGYGDCGYLLLRDARHRAGLSQLELGRRAGVTQSVVSAYESGARQHRVELQAVLARYGLSNARLFGSIARGDEGPESDVDLLVDVPPGVGLVALGRCQAELERILGAQVDLVPAGDLKAGVAAEVLAEAVVL